MNGEIAGESGAVVKTEGPLFLYDGDCGVCTRSVRFVLDRDRRGTVRFASLQGEVAARILARHPEIAGIDSMVWVLPSRDSVPERVQVRSRAAIAVGLYLGGVWGVVARIVRIVPRPLRDWSYDLFARHRKGVPGLAERCTLPTPEESSRFLDD